MRSKVERHWDEAEGNKGYQTGDSANTQTESA
jgi:hypothetical protein